MIFSLCDNLDNVNAHEPILNDTQKLDSVSKENLWLKLGKEIYRRQVREFGFYFKNVVSIANFVIIFKHILVDFSCI